MRVHVNEFSKGEEFASCRCSEGGVFIVEVNDDDGCIGGFVVEYGAISASKGITIPDCLGELVHGYVISKKVEAGEHSGFHFLDVIGVYWGIGIMGVSSAVGYEETLFKVACDGILGETVD
jgi:hypothetical protein